MKKIITVVCVLLMVVGCGGQNTNMTWEKVHEMVDGGELQSRIDQAIFDTGTETHPASIAVSDYFNFCFNGEHEKAWNLIEPNSPFMTEKGNLEDFSAGWEEGLKINSYNNLKIIGLEIDKEIAETRIVKIIFEVEIEDSSIAKTYTSRGKFKMSNITGKWMILSHVPDER